MNGARPPMPAAPTPSRLAILVALGRRSLVFAVIWIALVKGDPEGMLLGLVAVPGAVWVSVVLMPIAGNVSLLGLLSLVPGFVVGSILGGLDVAYRAVRPSMPLRPGWLRIDLRLPDGARVAYGGELSLMPGTLVAGIDDDHALVHVLDMADPGLEAALRRAEEDLVGVIRIAPPREGLR